MDDLISRQAAMDALHMHLMYRMGTDSNKERLDEWINSLPPAQPEIIRCKDCKFYSPMNRETKTGICNLTMHQNFGDNWFCAGAERRTNGFD